MELSRETIREGMRSFRSALKEETISASEKSITLERDGNVGIIVLDEQGSKANKLSTSNMLRLLELFVEVETDSKIGCLVFFSKKPTIFIAGADIAEIEMLASGKVKAADAVTKLQSVFTYLENLPIPTVAAIHGAVLGGGLELSLACDYRMASDSPATRLGLPEVMLGVLPGWGGTQRLPRLVGLEKSLDLILTGRHVTSKSALRMGLVDQMVPTEWLQEKALAWANELAKTRKKRRANRSSKEAWMEKVPGGKWLIFDVARKKLLKKTKGNYPAPLLALETIQATYGGNLESGLKKEAEAFSQLVKTSQCQNLIRVFYLNEGVKRDKGTESGVAGRKVQRAGVLGAGVMGGGIAQLFAQKGVRTRMKDLNWQAITSGLATAYKIFQKRVKRRKMKPNELDNAMSLIEGTTTFAGFKQLDLVVEAIVEDLEIKKKVLKELDGIVAPEAVIASNTSSLSVGAMADATAHPERVVGMHFFNPVEKMPLVEVIRGSKTSDEAVATVFQFAKKLGKTPVVVGDAPGFVVNRILGPYLNEAVYLLLEGMDPEALDENMEKFGMPMGPCTLLDEVGLDVAGKVSKILFGAFGERMKPPSVLDKVTEKGYLGKKAGRGIYIYESDKKSKRVDRDLLKEFKPKSRDSALTDDVVQRRMVYLMINEAANIVSEGLVRKVSDLDLAMIFGTGFAPFRGGVLRYADTLGAEAIVSELELYTRNYGERFKPSPYLQKLSVSGKNFYDT